MEDKDVQSVALQVANSINYKYQDKYFKALVEENEALFKAEVLDKL